MESGNGGASSKGVLIPVSDRSDAFEDCILTPLQSAYLYEESKQSFRYESAVLIKTPELEEKYNAFRAKRLELGYSEEDLKETYGFLLFDDVSKAHTLGETGVLTGNGTCTTLGDPAKGVYISMYSDCLDPNRWYHGKSGYVAIIKLTKGRVKKVFENYTQNFTAPTVGFDCHVSEQLPSVSANTSSFLAFERTQYYMYELLDDGSSSTAQSPSAACPFAIVSFSYTDTKAIVAVPQEKRYYMQRTLFSECCEEKKTVCHYLPWKGQLQIGLQFYNVGLKSTTKALFLTGKLPPVLKVDRAMSMLGLRQLLPRTVFETYFSGEVSLNGLYCSLCELVPSNVEETNSLALLVQEVKEKELALPVSLSDGGFLILLHSSHFLTYDDIGSNATKVLQGLFLFPKSRLIHRDTKFGDRKVAMSSEILRILPVLRYAQGEAEKTTIDPSEELCEVLAQHMQSYTALINPGLALSPSRDVNIFPDQYDVANAHKHLYSTTEWTKSAWQNVRSYLSKPLSFQLPVSKASELLAAGQQEQREDLDDDVYICLSSPDEVQAMESEHSFTFPESPLNTKTTVDSSPVNAEAHVGLTAVPQNVPHDCEAEHATKDSERSDLEVLIKKDALENNLLNLPTSDDLPAELILSITSAKRTDESLGSVISTVSETKHNDFELSGFSAAKLKTEGVNSLKDETAKMVNGDCTNVKKTRKVSRRRKRHRKKAPKAVSERPSVQTVKIHMEDNLSKSQNDDLAKEPSGHPQLRNPAGVDWRKLPRRKRKFGKLPENKIKLRSSTVGLVPDPRHQSTVTIEVEACTMRKKTERWDLKPVVSECGRILVPHGSVDFIDQIKYLKEKLFKQATNDKQDTENVSVVNAPSTCLNVCDTSVYDTVEMEQDSTTAPETGEDKTESTTSKDRVNHLQNTEVSDSHPEHVLAGQLGDDYSPVLSSPQSSEHSSKSDDKETFPSEAVNENHIDRLFLGDCGTKSEFLLRKLKSVLLRGKRTTDAIVSEGITINSVQDTEPPVKKSKCDSDTEALKSNNAVTCVRDTDKEPSETPSLDPLFAFALGLTPKERPHRVQNTESQDSQLPEKQEQLVFDKQPQIIQKPPSIFQRRGRIKTLKNHQGIPAEYIKQKWWLHFQTPACFASEKLKNKDSTRDNSVRKTVKEKMNSACTSTDALNLLADLALSASNGQVPQQPEPPLERKPETSFKNCDVTKDVTSAEQDSVLHSLLRQPASRAVQPLEPLEPPSPSRLVAGIELVDLISKEHAYSSPQSPSLLLGLPGTPFQVSPLCGSTRLLHHHLQFYGNGIQTLHPCLAKEDRAEHNHRTPEYLKKHVHRHKFRHSRTFFNKDGSIQITREWKENYDFNLDSKFTSDSKDRTIVRALHGPWDFSIEDTSEEVRLIVHMWIGLFYSRSTARFFQTDPNFTYSCLETNEPLDTLSGMTSVPAQLEQKGSSFEQFPNLTDTSDSSVSKALDLSKKDIAAFDQGAVILDLSLRNSNAETVSSVSQIDGTNASVSSQKQGVSETLTILKSFMGPQETSTFPVCQCYKTMAQSMESIGEVIDALSENETDIIASLQRAGCLEYTDKPLKGYESFISQPENPQADSTMDNVLDGSIEETADRKDPIKSSRSTEISLVQKRARKLSKSETNKNGESNKEAEEVVHACESQDRTNSAVKENSCSEDDTEPLKVISFGDNSANKESVVARCLENEKALSKEEPEAISQDQTENINGGVDCCTVKEGTVIREDHSEQPLGLDEQDGCKSFVEDDCRLSDEALKLIKKDSITEYSHQEPCDVQPSQEDGEEDTCNDLQINKNGDISTSANLEETPQTVPAMEPVCSEFVGEENSDRNICLMEKAGYQEAALTTSDEDACSLHGTCTGISVESLPKTMDNVEPGSNCFDKTNLRFGLSSDQETKSVEEGLDGAKIQQAQSDHLSRSPRGEAEETLTKEADLKVEEINEECEKSNKVVIPFIGIDISGVNIVQPHDSPPQGQVEEHVPDQIKIPFLSETTYLDSPTSQMYSENTELSKIPLSDLSKTHQTLFLGNEFDDRCPTPTMDEKPYEYIRTSDPVNNVINREQKYCLQTSTGNPNSHSSLHSELESRTQRVLKCIDMFLSKSNHTEKSLMETAGTNHNLVEIHKSSGKNIPTTFALNHTSTDCKQISNTMSDVASSSTSQELHTASSERHVLSPFIAKIEEVLGVGIQLKKTDSSVPLHHFERTDKLQQMSVGQDYCPSNASSFSETLGTSQSGLNLDLHSYSEHPVMAVKPSNCEESQGDHIYKDGQMEISPKSKQMKNPIVAYNTSTSREKTEVIKACSDGLNDHLHDSSDLKSKRLLNVGASKSNSTSTSFVDYQSKAITNDSLALEPGASITCTVYNTKQQRAHSLLEEVSKRCLQNDLTQASMEQEHLIFFEEIKQLFKKDKDTRDNSKSFCSSPLIVEFSKLEEQDDSLTYLDEPLSIGQKIMVDMCNRINHPDAREGKKALHCQGTGNPVEHAGVSDVTEECARLYETMMNNVCAVKKVSPRSKYFGMDDVNQQTEPHNNFDFCDQMKKEMDKSFYSNLNSVVKKSCKTKYRFYVLATSDDSFFDAITAALVEQGHTVIEPSKFFLCEDSSSLLIIIRNEDIAEHICKVPYLLELKKSPNAQFAGVDEADDVVNLTHQELFTRGGFIMFNRAAWESLSLCNMTKCSEILQELSRTGKWKWMLHYRDSRRLKENARLSADSKQKTHFQNWCQDTGILEVLPYHDCDLMSKDQPDYLACLVRLQVQNISARYPVFITDTTTDDAFGKSGIFTMTVNSFLTNFPGEILKE